MSQEKGNEDLNTQDLTNIEKLLKELAINVAKLNENILKTTKTYNSSADAVAAHSEQTKKNKLEVQQAYFDNLKEMAKWRKANKEGVSQFQMFTGILRNGVSALGVIRAVTDHLGSLGDKFDEHGRSVSELAELNEKLADRMSAAGKTGDPLTEVATQKERATHGELTQKTKDTTKDDNKTGAFFSFGKKFFEKHAAGLAIGAGAAVTLLKVLKMAFDASPMFQQMKKLLQFGVMMVLRPIGDFFGFLFRPILILLLRKFIIPWYTKMYPQMMKWGTEIGTKLAGALGALADGDIGKAFGILWGEVDWYEAITSVLRKVILPVAIADMIFGEDFDYGKAVSDWFTTGLETATTSWDKFWTDTYAWFSGGIKDIGDSWNKFWTETWTWFSGGIKTIEDSWNWLWSSVWNWFAGGIKDIEDTWNWLWYGVYNWFAGGIEGIEDTWNSIWTDLYEWFTKGITGITTHWDNFWEHIWSWLTGGTSDDNNKSAANTKGDGKWQWGEDLLKPETWADGGHITEPILGVGKSGKSYLMGESGNETVIPDDQLGGMGGITINIQNMSGSQQDLNNLRQTILDVVQESNSRRGRT